MTMQLRERIALVKTRDFCIECSHVREQRRQIGMAVP
jgi:hypothetical protein